MATVLIADYAAMMRRNIKTNLENSGHLVVGEASDGPEAVELFKKFNPDITLLDSEIPLRNGLAAMKQMRGINPKAKVIIMSTANESRDKDRYIDAGAKRFLLKPINYNILISSIYDIMEEAQEEAEQEAMEQILAAANADKVKKEDPPEKKVLPKKPETKRTFEINNVNGVFMIKMHKALEGSAFSSFESSVNGLLYINPKSIIFELYDYDDYSREFLVKVKGLIDKMSASSISIEINTEDDMILQMLAM